MLCANSQLPYLVIAATPSPCLVCVVTHWEGGSLSEGSCQTQCLLHAQLLLWAALHNQTQGCNYHKSGNHALPSLPQVWPSVSCS